MGTAPPATVGTPDEVAWLRGELRRTIADLEAKTVSADTLAHVAVCLARQLQQQNNAGIEVPIVIDGREYERLRGAEITVAGNAVGDIVVRFRERAPHPLIEGV